MTRTIAVGTPADWQREWYDLTARAQRAGREAAAPGVRATDVDAAARQVIIDAGRGGDMVGGVGHGVGLEVHEDPAVSPMRPGEDADANARRAATLQSGVPITVEPGVYVPGRGGVRIEDTIVVTDGEPELLTKTTKDLLVCAAGQG
jgi:Xaa-Pro aminopeptidase